MFARAFRTLTTDTFYVSQLEGVGIMLALEAWEYCLPLCAFIEPKVFLDGKTIINLVVLEWAPPERERRCFLRVQEVSATP